MDHGLRQQRLFSLTIVIVAVLLTLMALGCQGNRYFGSRTHGHDHHPGTTYGDYVEPRP